VIPWASRDALLDEMRDLESMKDACDAFVAVGTTQPVVLTDPQKGGLIDVIEVWGSQVPGGLTDGLPEGIFDLRNALHDDQHDAGVDASV
jgi:hypothetical protein